jgi:hypothetical protein
MNSQIHKIRLKKKKKWKCETSQKLTTFILYKQLQGWCQWETHKTMKLTTILIWWQHHRKVVTIKKGHTKFHKDHVGTLALGSRPRQGVARLRESRGKKPRSQKEGSPGAKAKALEGCGPRGSPGVITYSQESKEVRGSEHSHSQGNSHFGRGNLGGLPKLQSASWRVKSQWIVALLVPLKSSWNVDV